MLRVALLRQKIVHRNLCLENILLDAKGQSLSLCLRITAGIKCECAKMCTAPVASHAASDSSARGEQRHSE
jgi:hypothetical protein